MYEERQSKKKKSQSRVTQHDDDDKRTDVQPIIIPTQPVHDRLLGRRLVLNDIVRLAVLRDVLRGGRARDAFREFLPGRFRT